MRPMGPLSYTVKKQHLRFFAPKYSTLYFLKEKLMIVAFVIFTLDPLRCQRTYRRPMAANETGPSYRLGPVQNTTTESKIRR